MVTSIRTSTLQTLGLGNVLEIFEKGQLPVRTKDLVDQLFGSKENRGSLVISGANGIVGAGKSMQLGSRLLPYGVPMVALDMAGSPDGLGKQFQGLVQAFGRENANKIRENIIQLTYDGKSLPKQLQNLQPKFLLEAIPEILELKKSHYQLFRKSFPDIQISSVTSGFPSSKLGVGVSHPAFPHEINKVWEIVESDSSSWSHLLWSLGMVPILVSDHWSFVLDVLFCGLTLAGLRYHETSNMPFWKIDKYIRKILGANPFRAHDAIGAKGSNFLTWSCLHHLGKQYGELFVPTSDLVEGKESGQNWYPMNHFRPLVNWEWESEEIFSDWILGALFQMTSLMVQEKRGHLAHLNIMGELCAQFRQGTLALARKLGSDKVIEKVNNYHKLYPQVATSCWYPEVFSQMNTPEWQYLYVNAEHNGSIGVITIGRESYNHDVDQELNRAIDWLKKEGIKKVILSGDFHLSTQMIGADTSDFFPALEDRSKGLEISEKWSKTARRFHYEFECSLGFIGGKRCLGGGLELMLHCHYVVALSDTKLGFPEVTIPVVPGMEGCHWSFRKTEKENWSKLLELLLEGKSISGSQATGWLIDFSGSMEEALSKSWKILTNNGDGLAKRKVTQIPLEKIEESSLGALKNNPSQETSRKAIFKCIQESCGSTLDQALSIQSAHSADFMTSKACHKGALGTAFNKTMNV